MPLNPQLGTSGGGLYPASSQSHSPAPLGANHIAAVPGLGTGILVQVLGNQHTPVVCPADLNENPLYSLQLPPLDPNDSIIILTRSTYTNNANLKLLRFRLAGQSVSGYSFTTTQSSFNFVIFSNRNSRTSQVGISASTTNFGPVASGTNFPNVDTSVSQLLTITGTLANIADNLTLESALVLRAPGINP